MVTDEISVLVEMSRQLIEENSRAVHDQDEYQRRHSALVEKYTDADAHLKALQAERSRRIDMRKSIEWFMESFSRQDGLLTEFDTIKVYGDKWNKPEVKQITSGSSNDQFYKIKKRIMPIRFCIY